MATRGAVRYHPDVVEAESSVKQPSRIIALLSVAVLFSWPAVSAQEGAPRFSLLSGLDASPLPPGFDAGVTELPPSTEVPSLGSGALLLDPSSLGLRPLPAAGARRPAERGPGGLTYRLGDTWTAGVSYRHALLFGTSTGEALRQHQFGDFATDRDRDVVKLDMSWDLAATQLDLGYRLESARAEPGQDSSGRYSLLGVLPESEHTLHSLTFGVTRRWGGADR
jgi:hypothetical protein